MKPPPRDLLFPEFGVWPPPAGPARKAPRRMSSTSAAAPAVWRLQSRARLRERNRDLPRRVAHSFRGHRRARAQQCRHRSECAPVRPRRQPRLGEPVPRVVHDQERVDDDRPTHRAGPRSRQVTHFNVALRSHKEQTGERRRENLFFLLSLFSCFSLSRDHIVAVNRVDSYRRLSSRPARFTSRRRPTRAPGH